jgi:fucose permease
MVERSTGTSLADATLTISVFIGGVILARAAVSSPAIGSIEPVWLLRSGLVLALVGSLLLWATSSYEISIVAMLIGGAGVGVLYPVSASVTLATTSGQSALASSRVVLGSGIAILVAPFALGVLADMMGVVSAWLLLPLICLASMLLTVPLGAARGRRPSVGYPTD